MYMTKGQYFAQNLAYKMHCLIFRSLHYIVYNFYVKILSSHRYVPIQIGEIALSNVQ